MQRIVIALASTVFALGSLSACGGSKVLAEADLEEGVSKQLTEMAGSAPDDVDCPGDLAAEVGETIRCTLTAGADELGLTVTVTGVDGTQVDYDVEVDEM